jgi:helix-turn-helix protein
MEVSENGNAKICDNIIFGNIKDVEIEENDVNGEIEPVLKIQQLKEGRIIISYLYTLDER